MPWLISFILYMFIVNARAFIISLLTINITMLIKVFKLRDDEDAYLLIFGFYPP